MEEVKTKKLFDLNECMAKDLLEQYEYPWQALPHIEEWILANGPKLPKDEYDEVAEHVWVHKTAKIFDSAYIKGPTIIGKNTEVRHCAFIRGKAIIGNDCVVGNSTEVKNAIMFNVAKAPHYSYVGDTILGFHAHMGAGAIASNLKSEGNNITIKKYDEESNLVESLETGMRKIGAMVGDYAEIGSQCVLNPGTIIGKNSNIYPLSSVRGVVPANHIYKSKDAVIEKKS